MYSTGVRTMTRDEAVALIAARLGFRTGLENSIVAELQAAQLRLEEEVALLPWFLRKERVPATLPQGDYLLGLPNDFLTFGDDGFVELEDGDTVSLLQQSTDPVNMGMLNLPPARPSAFVLRASSLVFNRRADKPYTILSTYYGRDAVLNTNIENGWLRYAADLLINETGMVVAQFLRDPEAVQLFNQKRVEARSRLVAMDVQRKQPDTLKLGDRTSP